MRFGPSVPVRLREQPLGRLSAQPSPRLKHGRDGGDRVPLQPVVHEDEREALRPRRLPLRDERPASSPRFRVSCCQEYRQVPAEITPCYGTGVVPQRSDSAGEALFSRRGGRLAPPQSDGRPLGSASTPQMASGHFQRCVRPQPGDRGDGDCELAGWIANLTTIFETVWDGLEPVGLRPS